MEVAFFLTYGRKNNRKTAYFLLDDFPQLQVSKQKIYFKTGLLKGINRITNKEIFRGLHGECCNKVAITVTRKSIDFTNKFIVTYNIETHGQY